MTPAGQTTLLDPDDADELSAIRAELARQEQTRQQAERRAPRGFDPAAVFLLDWHYLNLFEPTTAEQGAAPEYRCKGCNAILSPGKRAEHHASHRRTRDAKSAPTRAENQPTLEGDDDA